MDNVINYFLFVRYLGVEYSIIVYTGSVAKAGTRAQVFVTLKGNFATSSEIHLKSPALESSIQTAG